MLTAFVLGIVGSLHCVGMCGPIVLALPPDKTHTRNQFFLSRLTYNGGRLITYAVLGMIFGSLGHLMALAGLQSMLSITLGVLILASLFKPVETSFAAIAHTHLWRKTIGALFRKKSYSALLGIGLLNGLLPCGLVYTALAGATASGDGAFGALFMVIFGLGTIPALIGVAFIGRGVVPSGRQWLRKALPAATFILGVLLILRGMSLGIPYISPNLEMQKTEQGLFIPHCH